jgi:mono/diheme cytochrome c family protein
MMPYESFREMSDEDVRSVVVYLRTLPPVRNQVPPKKIDFPVNLFVKAAPRPVEGVLTTPDPRKDPLGYGGYLVTISSCRECHTPHDEKGQRIPSLDFSGGWEMLGPWGRVVTANITPHKDTYMGKATREEFIGRFKSFESLQGENAPIAPKGQNTVMPWLPFSGMTTDDLGMIYDYLKTIPPMEHRVVTFPDAPKPSGSAP